MFVNYANVHKAFQRILTTRAQIDLADIVRVKKDNDNSIQSFGRAIGTLRQMQKSRFRNEKKKLLGAYIEILESVRDHAGIYKSGEKYIQFDTFRSSGGGGGFSGFGGGGGGSAFAMGAAGGGFR